MCGCVKVGGVSTVSYACLKHYCVYASCVCMSVLVVCSVLLVCGVVHNSMFLLV